ncbi:dihydropyrimidinase [bacterium]|nr:dihydropyrimidinase [bacterium]
MKALLIKNGYIVTESGAFKRDLRIEEGLIAEIGCALDEVDDCYVLEARNRIVFPGIIDAHTHLGIPVSGTWSSDDFTSGSRAAIMGGVTTILDFTVQEPGETLYCALQRRKSKADNKTFTDYGLHCNVTSWSDNTLAEIPAMIREGVTSFKVFFTYRETGMMISKDHYLLLAEQINSNGGLLMIHAEDDDLVHQQTQALIRDGKKEYWHYSRSRDPHSESQGIQQAIDLNRKAKCPLYIVHISSAQGIELAAKQKMLSEWPVFLETCPQYLLLDQENYRSPDGVNFVTTPPIRNKKDQSALWDALQKGYIDVIATDHCPFWKEQKERHKDEFYRVPGGLPGIETLLPLMYQKAVRERGYSVNDLVRVLCTNPAKIFGLYPRKGVIRKGSDADLVIFDPDREVTLSSSGLHMNTDFCPYEGMKVKGYPETVIRRGEIMVENYVIKTQIPRGRFIPAII